MGGSMKRACVVHGWYELRRHEGKATGDAAYWNNCNGHKV
jgi:hypothetical protein